MPICRKCNSKFPNRIKIDNKTRNISRRKYCIDCSPFGKHNTRQIHIDKNKRRKFDNSTKYQNNARTVKKKKLLDMKGGKCIVCGYNKCLDAIEFHHLNPKEKEFNIGKSVLTSLSWDKILKEAEKTVPVCGNCHSEIHAGMIDI